MVWRCTHASWWRQTRSAINDPVEASCIFAWTHYAAEHGLGGLSLLPRGRTAGHPFIRRARALGYPADGGTSDRGARAAPRRKALYPPARWLHALGRRQANAGALRGHRARGARRGDARGWPRCRSARGRAHLCFGVAVLVGALVRVPGARRAPSAARARARRRPAPPEPRAARSRPRVAPAPLLASRDRASRDRTD